MVIVGATKVTTFGVKHFEVTGLYPKPTIVKLYCFDNGCYVVFSPSMCFLISLLFGFECLLVGWCVAMWNSLVLRLMGLWNWLVVFACIAC